MAAKIRQHSLPVFALIAAAIIVVTSGCAVRRVRLHMNKERRIVKLKGAESVKAQVIMKAGDLEIDGGTAGADLVDAAFTYSLDSWKPKIGYDRHGKTGELRIVGPEQVSSFFQSRTINRWDLQFNDDVPIELSIRASLGDTNLQLGNLDLHKLRLSSSAGDANIDLAGKWKHDVDVNIATGPGDLVLRLPKDFPVRVDIDTGLSDISAPGFKTDDDAYINDAYAPSKKSLNIKIKHQAGDIGLELVE